VRYIIISLSLITTLIISGFCSQSAHSQPAKTIALSTMEGALTGAMLGAGTMALKNNGDIDPLRIGVGAGALYGAASGIYDIATLGPDQTTRYGWFTNGRYSTTIVLKDTFYGGVIGTLLGSAIVLINGESFTDGLRKGVGAGVWTGFGFGLLDAYIIAGSGRFSYSRSWDRNIQPYSMATSASAMQKRAAGLVTYQPTSALSFGSISPQYYKKSLNKGDVEIGLNAISVAWNF